MTASPVDGTSHEEDNTNVNNSAASAGSESPEEGQKAMDAAEDAVVEPNGND